MDDMHVYLSNDRTPRKSPRGSPRMSPSASPRTVRTSARASPVNIEEESPRSSKRRRLNSDDSCSDSASSVGEPSPRGSPTPLEDGNTENGFHLHEFRDRYSPPISFSSPLANSTLRSEINGESFLNPKPEVLRSDAGSGDFQPLTASNLSIDSIEASASDGLSGKVRRSLMMPPAEIRNKIHGNNLSFESLNSSAMSSIVSTPTDSPYSTLTRTPVDYRKKYKKDELWAAIASDYQYLMGDDIIETCKSTESDLSWESDEGTGGQTTQVSFNEFLQQYKELTEWLNTIHSAVQRKSTSLSEKYLNQTYHEEMLERSPRRRLLNEYAKQLQRRYPSMRDEIQARLQRLNGLWEKLEKAICPTQGGAVDEATMIKDLSEDLQCLQKWVVNIEAKLAGQTLKPDWTPDDIKIKMQEQKVQQEEIESHNKVISAILKLCERLECREDEEFQPESEKESLQLLAIGLQKRWHAIWLQSLEWQYRLEEGHIREQGLYKVQLADDIPFDNENDNKQDQKNKSKPAEPIGTQTDFTPTPSPLAKRLSDFGTDPINISAIDFAIGESSESVNRHSKIDHDYTYEHQQYSGNDFQRYDGNDSETSLCDIIPFSENEYEKIPVDSDGNTTDLCEEESYPKIVSDSGSTTGHFTGSGAETDQGIDSALGRSYSDHSVEGYSDSKESTGSVYHSAIRLPSETDTTQSNARRSQNVNMTSLSSGQVGKKRKSPIVKSKRRQHDIGYSSESHSNEELDERKLGFKPGAFGSQTSDNAPNAGIPLRVGSKAPSAQSSWRHSMTSAYETASNGSDPNLLENDGTSQGVERTKATSPDIEPHDSGFASANCPSTGDEYSMSRSQSASQNFLCLTAIEGDSSSSVDPQSSSQSYPYDRCESGNTSEMGSMDIPLDDIPEERNEGSPGIDASSSRQRLFGRNEDLRNGKYLIDDSFSLDETEINTLSSAANQLIDMFGTRDERGDSLSVQLNSGASSRAAALSDDELAAVAESLLSDRDTVPTLKAPNLVKQIDLMIRERELNKLTNHTWPKYLEPLNDLDMKAGFKARANDSFTSTDGSMRAGRRRISSCDASDESGSEISVSAVSQEGKHMLNLSPFSISESAIDDHDTQRRQNKVAYQNLRRTASEQQSPNKYLQRSGGDVSSKKRRRRLRQSLSEETRTPTKRLSPGSSRNRLQLKSSGRASGKPQRRSASPVLEGQMRSRVMGARRALDYSYSDSDMEIRTLPICTSSAAEDPQTATTAPSAVEFSEEGWDNYQMPPQNVLSDASEEQKLDSSYFQREWDVNSQSGDCLPYGQLARPSKAKGAVVLDSDSDLEDFQSVIDDSTKALVFTECVLTKRRKDDMETGISLEPSEYKESLATCETNVRCLDDVVKTLQGEVGISNVTSEDIDHVQDMICKWESMETLAIERLQQSQQLKGVFEDMRQMQIALDEMDSVVKRNGLSSVMDMEASIFAVKQRRDSLSKHRDKLRAIGIKIQAFENNNDHVNMNKFMKEVDNLDAYVEELTDRSEQRVTDLQSALLSWYDLKEKTGELEHSIDREIHQVRALEVAHECLKPGQCTSQQIIGARADLTTLEEEFKPLSSQLHMLRALQADVAPFLARDTELQLRTQVGMQESALSELKVKHETLLLKVEQAAAPSLQRQSSTESLAPRVDERTFLMRLLRAALPFSMVLLAVLVLVYLLDPELFDNAGIVISPQLKYVRGAPPT